MLIAVGAWWLFARAGLATALTAAGESLTPRSTLDHGAPYALVLAGAALLGALVAL
jgi:hypothetical protein